MFLLQQTQREMMPNFSLPKILFFLFLILFPGVSHSDSGIITEPPTINFKNLIENRSPFALTTSSNFVLLQPSASFKFNGRPVLFILNAISYSTAAFSGVEFAIQIDSGADNVIAKFFFNTVNTHSTVTGMVLITPPAGDHVINLRWRRFAGGGTIYFNPNGQALLQAIEL